MSRRIHTCQRDVQYFANVKQPHRTDAVGSLFIILNLLKRYAERSGKLFLSQVKRQPVLAYSRADIFVNL